MSNYNDFIHDFPDRCHEILEISLQNVEIKKRDVTLALMVASTAFVIPFERLHSEAHISKDNVKFYDTAEKLKDLLNKINFVGSIFCESKQNSWRCGEIEPNDGNSEPDRWISKPFTVDKEITSVFKIIRNALAHGNIFTKADKNQINEIIFCSKKDKNIEKYKFVSVSPVDFMKFIDGWFRYLKENNLSYRDAQYILAEAA